ncbi:MAG TPA: branched-chain amino acid ABC transporter permease [bacterium]|nr:branched-chain amino acid ABC transporter permease [bacterium]
MSEFLQQTINGLAWGSIYALIALGYTMVYGVLRLINFAHGDVYMVGAMIGYYVGNFLARAAFPGAAAFPVVLISSMAVCGALGFVIERAAYRPLRSAPRINALITAIGVSLFLEFGGQLLFGADPKVFPQLLQERPLVQFDGVVINQIQAVIFVVAVLLMVGLRFIVQKTKLGKAMRAVSFSHTASQLVGIPLDRVISFTFVLGSMLAAAGGVLVGISNPKVEPLMGIMPGLKAFVAAVLGGIGNIPGALAGGLLMGLSETYVVGYVSSTYRDALAFVLLILILLVRPGGLFGKSASEKV